MPARSVGWDVAHPADPHHRRRHHLRPRRRAPVPSQRRIRWNSMPNHNTNRSSLLSVPLARLSARILAPVRRELAGALIAELERHFNEELLPDLQQRVEEIVTRELDRRMEEIVLQELRGPEAVRCRPDYLERRFTEVYEKALWGDDETRSGWGSKRDGGHVQTALEILRMVIPKYDILSIADIPCGDFNWQP